jgi:tetratricopeptide (TPR) repeat protein
LNEVDSSHHYDVINAGGISYASYRVVVLMKELVRYKPDLFVIYTGHNEFLEERTYGDIINEGPLLRALKKQLFGLRTVALVRKGTAEPGDDADSPSGKLQSEVQAKLDVWSGLEAFTRNEPLKRAILEHFRFNVQQMIDIARDHDVDLLFVNPVSNVQDFSPFKSEHLPSLSPERIDRFQTRYQEAQTLLQTGNYREALTLLEKAAELSPDYADLHYRMGRCYLGLGDIDQADRYLTRAKELDICPLRALAEINAAVMDTARQNGAPVVDLLDILRQDSLARDGHGILGNDYFLDHVHPRIEVHQRLAEWILDALSREGLVRIENPLTPEERASLYSDALEALDPSYYAQRDLNLGKVLGWAGKNEEAAEAFRRASANLPDDAMTRYNLGIVLQKQGDFQGAIEQYRAVVGVHPQFAEAHFNLGKCYQKLGASDEAVGEFQKVLQIEPDDAKAHYNLALCYRELDRFDQELVELEKAWAADPELPGVSRLMGSVYEREGRLDDALQAYRQNLERHPEDPSAHNEVGVIHRLMGQFDEALRASSRALELDPEFAEGHRNLAWTYEARGEREAAEKAFQEVAALEPEDSQAFLDLGRFYHKEGRWDDAVSAYRKAIALDPTRADGYSNLGAAYGQKGLVSEAIGAFRKAIELNPHLGGAHYHLASLYLSRRELELAGHHFQKAQELGIEVPDRIMEELGPLVNPDPK